MQKQQVSGEESAGGTRLVELSSGALRPRSLLLGLLLCLPGMTLSPVGAVEDSPEVLNLGVGGGAALSVEERGRWDGRRDLGEGIPGSGELSVLPGLEREAVSSRDEEQRFMERVLHRVSDQVWSAGMSLLTPDRLLATASAAREGTLSQHGSQALQGLQDQMLNAVIDAGVDELQRRAENQYLRNLEIRYQTPLSGRSGTFNVDALFSFLDQGRQSIFGQVGGLFGGDDSGFNFGLGYRRLLPNDRVLLGANFFYDYSTDAELQRVSLGLEAKSTALDLYFNWYHMIGTGNGVGDGFLSYTPDGLDIEVAGRLPSVPWVELSGRYYYWFLEDDDVYRARDGRGLSGFNYKLVLQPMPMFGLELQLDQPEKGAVEWGLGAQLKYRFGVPLQEQVRTRRVKAHAPLHRRFERVRREYKVLVRRRAGGPGTGQARPRLDFTRVSYKFSRRDPAVGRPVTLRVENAALDAGTETLTFSFEAITGAVPLPSVDGQAMPTGADYTLQFPGADFDTANAMGTGASGTPYEVVYRVPAGGLSEDDVVIFSVAPSSPSGTDTRMPDQVFSVTVSGGGLTASTRVTLTDDDVRTVGVGAGGTVGGGAAVINIQEPEGGDTQPTPPAVLSIPLFDPSDFSDTDLPLELQVRVSSAGSTAACTGARPDYRIFDDNGAGSAARACTESDVDGGYTYTYRVTSLDNPALKFQMLSDDLYKDVRTIRLSLQSVTGAESGAEYDVAESEQVINIYDAEDDLPELSLALFADAAEASAAISPECPGMADAQTLTEQASGAQQEEAVLRLCSSKPIAQGALEVSLEAASGVRMAGLDDFAVQNFVLTIPVTEGRDQTKSGDLPLPLAPDTAQEGEEMLILDIPAPPTAAADCPMGSVGLGCYSGAGPRYKLSSSQYQVTVTVMDDDNATISFAAAASGPVSIAEAGNVDVTLTTGSGGLSYGAADADVWVMVSEACGGRLTVTQAGSQINLVTGTPPIHWEIPFPTDAATTTFNLAFVDDAAAMNQACVLRIISNGTDSSAYTPAAEDAGGRLELQLQDNDLPSIQLSDDVEQIQEGGSYSVTATVQPNGANCSSLSFGYTLTGLEPLQTLVCSGTGCPTMPLAEGTGNLEINCTGTPTVPFTLTLTFTSPDDNLSSGDRTVSFNLVQADTYSLPGTSSFTLTVQEDDVVTFGFQPSTLTVPEGAAALLEVVPSAGGAPTVDLQIPVAVNPSVAGELAFFSANDRNMALQACQEPFGGNGWCLDGAALRLQIKGSTTDNFPPRLWVSAEDDTDSDSETFVLTMQEDAAAGRWAVPSALAMLTISIADDEAIPSVFLGDSPSLVEPATGTSSAVLPVRVVGLNSINCPSGESLSIRYSIDVSSTAAQADYTLSQSSPLTVDCPATGSEASGDITIQLAADEVIEGEESLILNLLGPEAGARPYQLGLPGSAQLTILDPAPTSGGPRVFISNNTASSLELSEGAGAREVTFRIQPRSNVARTITLALNVAGTSSTDDFDGATEDIAFSATSACGAAAYAGGGVPVTFPANTSTASIYVCAFNDDLVEGPENLDLELAAGTGYQITGVASGSTERAVSIADNDDGQLPVVYVERISPERLSEADAAGTPVTVTVRVNAASATTLGTLGYNLGAPEAPAADKADAADISEPRECTLQAATGTTAAYYSCTGSNVSSGVETALTFNVLDDDIDEDNEDLTFSIRDNPSYRVATGKGEAALNITDDDAIEVRFTVPAPPPDLKLYYDDAREGMVLPINYGYAGELGANVQRQVSLQIASSLSANAVAECGAAPDAGGEEAGMLPDSPMFAGRGGNNDYQLRIGQDAQSLAFPAANPLNFNFGPGGVDSSLQGSRQGLFYVHVRDEEDSERSEYICLRFRKLPGNVANVDAVNDRYLLRIPANDLPRVQIADTMLLRGGSSPVGCSPDSNDGNADCNSIYEGNPSGTDNFSITSSLTMTSGIGDNLSFCVTPLVQEASGFDIKLTDGSNFEATGVLQAASRGCIGSRYLIDGVDSSIQNYTLAVNPVRNIAMARTDGGAVRENFIIRVEPSQSEEYVVAGGGVKFTVVDDDLLVSSGLSANEIGEGTSTAEAQVPRAVDFTLTFTDTTDPAPNVERTRTVPVKIRLDSSFEDAAILSDDYRLFLINPGGGDPTEITSGQVVNGDLTLNLEITMGAGGVKEATRRLRIEIIADGTDEPDERVSLQVLEELAGRQGATNRPYRLMGASEHNLVITDDDGPVALNLVVGDPVPISDPVGEGESPGYTLAVNINCRDGGVGKKCSDQMNVPVYLFFKDPGPGSSGRARYGVAAGAGDYRALLGSPDFADRVEGQNYVQVGQFAQLAMGPPPSTAALPLIVSTEPDNLFEGKEDMVFQLCVGGVSDGVCDNPLFPEDDYSLSVFDEERDLPTLTINRPRVFNSGSLYLDVSDPPTSPAMPTLEATSSDIVLTFSVTQAVPGTADTSDLELMSSTTATRMVGFDVLEGRAAFTLTIRQPGGLIFANGTFFEFPALCDRLGSGTTINLTAGTFNHYKVGSEPGSYTCPSQ